LDALQVVNLGCGLDTRPWRLALPANVAWIDVDTVEVIELKRRLLQEQVLTPVTSTCSASVVNGGW